MANNHEIFLLRDAFNRLKKNSAVLDDLYLNHNALTRKKVKRLESSRRFFTYGKRLIKTFLLISTLLSLVLSIGLFYFYVIDLSFIETGYVLRSQYLFTAPIIITIVNVLIVILFMRSDEFDSTTFGLGFIQILIQGAAAIITFILFIGFAILVNIINFVFSLFQPEPYITPLFETNTTEVFYATMVIMGLVLISYILTFSLSYFIVKIILLLDKEIKSDYISTKAEHENDIKIVDASIKVHEDLVETAQTEINQADFIIDRYKTKDMVNAICKYMKEYTYYQALNLAIFDQMQKDHKADINELSYNVRRKASEASAKIDEMNLRLKVRDEIMADNKARLLGRAYDLKDEYEKRKGN